MKTDFLIEPIARHQVDEWFRLSDARLAERHGQWLIADSQPGYPCRISLEEAQLGERVLLIPYLHHDVASPYRASGPIYLREQAQTATLAINAIPPILAERLLSVRAYTQAGMMRQACTTQGAPLTGVIQQAFHDPKVAYLQIHNANPGCFNCTVRRV
jgi:hypothetical protein